MGKKKWQSGISLALTAVLAVGSVFFAAPVPIQAKAMESGRELTIDGSEIAGDLVKAASKTYYIDAKDGNDSNDGTSEAKAWKSFANLKELKLTAGNQVLLKAGCVWNGEKLEITGAEGTQDQPVILGKYGEGADPVINGQGDPWLTDRSNLKKEDVAVVHVKNSKYITIQNLEVTNWEADQADLMGETNSKVKYDQSKYMLTGILVENRDAGDLPGIVIKDNFVHDVNGYMSVNETAGDKKGSGGIIVLVTGGDIESFYTDLKVTGNKVEKVSHEAIYMESCWAARKLVGGEKSQQAGSKKWVGWPNVYVAHNYVNEVAGDGIVLINADGGTAEYNLVTASASEDWNYSRNPAHAAIWMWDCNNVTMQYNEAAYTESTKDGMAFDCDYGNQNVMYQYNYSHENKGGFWMACPGPYYTVNAVVRYNVSVNDGLFDGSRIVHVGEYGSIGNQVYNNTIYWDTGYKDIKAVEQGTWTSGVNGTVPAFTSGTDIYNNVFCGDSVLFANHDGIRYDSNCVWGSSKDVYPLEEDINAVVADPGFVDVKDYTTGTFAGGKVTLGLVNGFMLKQDSPCINTGRDYLPVPKESLPEVADELVDTHITLENKDYAQKAVPYTVQGADKQRIDIGALEYQGEKTAQAADKSYLTMLLDKIASYKETEFGKESWEKLKTVADSAKALLNDATAIQASVDSKALILEKVLQNMERVGSDREGTAADDILGAYHSSDTVDNSGFEKSEKDWGTWQSSVSVSDEQAHTGTKSLKVVQSSSDKTAYSELGGIPVEKNKEYILEAWVYCGNEDITKVGLEAKHHANVAGTEIKLGNMNLSSNAEKDDKGWYQAKLSFATKGYEKISISVASEIGTVYLDDVVLYPKTVKGDAIVLDKKELDKALALEPAQEPSYYSANSWKNFQNARLAAKVALVDAMADQDSITKAADDLKAAFEALTKKADKRVLDSVYQSCAKKKKGSYTDTTWNTFQKALSNAKAVLDNEDADQQQVDKALDDLKKARDGLKTYKSQTIKYTKTYSKAYGAKAFKLGAKVTTGNGKLSFKSSDKKVATVSSTTGKVTIKGTGACTITVTAAKTSTYKAKSVTITIKVNPKKTTLSSVKAVKGKKMTIKWKKDTKASGYEVQYCLKKNFKSGVKKKEIKKPSTTSVTVTKLSKGKKYYVRIRAYKTAKVNGKTTKLYGSWSSAKLSGKIK